MLICEHQLLHTRTPYLHHINRSAAHPHCWMDSLSRCEVDMHASDTHLLTTIGSHLILPTAMSPPLEPWMNTADTAAVEGFIIATKMLSTQ